MTICAKQDYDRWATLRILFNQVIYACEDEFNCTRADVLATHPLFSNFINKMIETVTEEYKVCASTR